MSISASLHKFVDLASQRHDMPKLIQFVWGFGPSPPLRYGDWYTSTVGRLSGHYEWLYRILCIGWWGAVRWLGGAGNESRMADFWPISGRGGGPAKRPHCRGKPVKNALWGRKNPLSGEEPHAAPARAPTAGKPGAPPPPGGGGGGGGGGGWAGAAPRAGTNFEVIQVALSRRAWRFLST